MAVVKEVNLESLKIDTGETAAAQVERDLRESIIRLELAPGMNVLFGPNESGKSSWHAAIYAGLCGIRRGPGIRNDAREFAARHHPWRGDEWSASVVVLLTDGRRIRIGQNLADPVDFGRIAQHFEV